MILTDIGEYVADRGQASLTDIALHFDIEADLARDMLQIWQRKGTE